MVRQCVTDRWCGEFSIDTNVSENSSIKAIVDAFTKSEKGEYNAYLINIRNNEQVVHTFEQYCYPSWKQEVGGVSTQTNHDDYEIDYSEGTRLNQLIRDQVSAIKQQKGKK